MDKPQEQIPTSGTSYRYMAYPFRSQPLQLLYPGRFMNRTDAADYSNIPNEDPVGLEARMTEDSALSYAYQREIEAMERMLGGKNKIAVHPAVPPEAILDNAGEGGGAGLESVINNNYGPGADLESVPSPLDSLDGTEASDSLLITDARTAYGKAVGNETPAGPINEFGSVPKKYDWEDIPTPNSPVYEYFEDARSRTSNITKSKPSPGIGFSRDSMKGKGITWFRVLVLITVILLFTMLVMMGINIK